ncbi:MAG: hypothetical protein J7M38_10965 [Armatimonadetes bacterium]|nr:hypothetical protein [Armatimonadota bacterium]
MKLVSVALITAFVLTCPIAFAWTLAENIDGVLMYDAVTLNEFTYSPGAIRGHRAHLMPTAFEQPDGTLRPYADGMQVAGELRRGQVLLTPDTSVNGSWVEFVVHGGTRLDFQFGLCDRYLTGGGEGTKLHIMVTRGGRTIAETRLRLTEVKWSEATLTYADAPADVLVRILVEFVGHRGSNWSALVLEGDGEFGTRDEARALSPNSDRIGRLDMHPGPAPKRVTARPGYDVLFYGDEPFVNLAAKGHASGSQPLQVKAGCNLYYVEGATFINYWREGAEDEGVAVPDDAPVWRDLWLCQQNDMPYKTSCSMGHCVPFLPPWLVAKYDLDMQDHTIRPHRDYFASFIKPKTLELHKRGLEGWLAPFRDQAAILVLGQEDEIALWDDQSEIAANAWREWLKRHFHGDWNAFAEYVGGVEGASSFAEAPCLKWYRDQPAYGYPKRAAFLKQMWAVEAYADYLAVLRDQCNRILPGVPVTQRYVSSPHGRAISELVGFDYNYCYGHLSVEGVSGAYGSGKKIWTGIYGHCGVLPLPRGGSVGLTIDRDTRRAQMGDREWELNIFTQLANGCTGFEASPFFNSWGPRWEGGALMDRDGNLTENGRGAKRCMDKVRAVSRYMQHYDRYEDIAVYHDAAWQTRRGAGIGLGLSQSKVGIYTFIRELGYHCRPLTTWDMTAENLADKKVLVLAGSVPIAPEVQDVIRGYVRGGGTLLAIYCARGQGFPGCNGWEFTGDAEQCAAEMSFENPPAKTHLGDVLGIVSGGGAARHTRVIGTEYTYDLTDFNALVDEGRWVNQEACCGSLVPAEGARVGVRFEDGAPAIVMNRFGAGVAMTVGVDVGLIANNLTDDILYRVFNDLFASLGCRKVYDTGDWFVEAGMWHTDAGEKLLILINHDEERAHTVKLPDGTEATIEPWRAFTWTSDGR